MAEANFAARKEEIRTELNNFGQEVQDYLDQGFNPDDDEVLQRVSEIKSIVSSLESEIQEILDFFHTRKDQLPFEPGRTNIDSVNAPGDPRRPNLDG